MTFNIEQNLELKAKLKTNCSSSFNDSASFFSQQQKYFEIVMSHNKYQTCQTCGQQNDESFCHHDEQHKLRLFCLQS